MWHFCPKKCQTSMASLLTCNTSPEFILLIPNVKCPFIDLHTCSCFAICYLFPHLPSSQTVSLTSSPLPGNYLPAHGRTAEQRLNTALNSIHCWVHDDITSDCKLEVNRDTHNMMHVFVWNIRLFKESGLLLQSCDCFVSSRKVC